MNRFDTCYGTIYIEGMATATNTTQTDIIAAVRRALDFVGHTPGRTLQVNIGTTDFHALITGNKDRVIDATLDLMACVTDDGDEFEAVSWGQENGMLFAEVTWKQVAR